MVLFSVPAPADARCRTHAECVQKRACSQKRVVPCIHRAAIRWGQPFKLLHRIAWCESTLRARVVNSIGASGLMQFMPRTWRSTPYGHRWVLSAKYNALAGAWLLRRNGTWPWVASRHCWG